MEYDILVKNATIVEGTGKKAYKGSLGVKGDRVAANEIEARRHPEGVEYVLVNGVPVVEKGKHTGATPGRVLKRA